MTKTVTNFKIFITVSCILFNLNRLCCQNVDLDFFKISPFYGIAAVASQEKVTDNAECLQHLKLIAHGIESRNIWAVKLLDASGTPLNRLHWGYTHWFGSETQCLTSHDREPIQLNPRVLINAEDMPPFQVGFFAAYFKHNSDLQMKVRWKDEDVITMTMCLPSSCSGEDIAQLLQNYFDSGEFYFQNLYNTSLRVTYVKDRRALSLLQETPTIITLIILVVAVGMCIIGTIYDVYNKKNSSEQTISSEGIDIDREIDNGVRSSCTSKIKNKNTLNGLSNELNNNINNRSQIWTRTNDDSGKVFQNANNSTEICKPNWNEVKTYFLFFSLPRNFNKIFEPAKTNTLLPVMGLRVLATLHILYGHTNLFIFDYSDTKIYGFYLTKFFTSQFIANGTLAVNTFFVISGFLVGYSFLNNPDSKQYQNGQKYFISSVVKRYLRFTPLNIIITLLTTVHSLYQRDQSWYLPTERSDINCSKYWWRNLLYITNFYPQEEMCMFWSWYICVDIQLYVVCLLICLIYRRLSKLAISLLCSLCVAAFLFIGYGSYSNDVHATLDDFNQNLSTIYFPPWVHLGSYAVGFITANLIVKVRTNKIKLKKVLIISGWIIAPILNTAVLSALYYKEMGVTGFAIYIAVSRTLWGISIAWVLFACFTGHGGFVNQVLSHKVWRPLNALTYAIYLLNPLVMYIFYNQSDAAWPLALFPSVLHSVGFMVIVPAVALIFVLLFEMPCTSIIDHILVSPSKHSIKEKEN